MSNQLIIVRGLPGSGKSTFAELLLQMNPTWCHFEADMYHVRNGIYSFRPYLGPLAHEWCQRKVKEHLEQGDNVVVSNTFTTLKEMDFYLKLPFPTTVIKCEGDYGNVHDVPFHVLNAMKKRFEEYE